MTSATAAGPTPEAPVLHCPSCGNDGTRGVFRYMVDVVSWAEVIALRRGDVIELAGALAPTMNDKVERPRLECHAIRPAPDNRFCGHRWTLPESIRGIAWRVPS